MVSGESAARVEKFRIIKILKKPNLINVATMDELLLFRLLVTVGKVLNRVILERMKEAPDSKLPEK